MKPHPEARLLSQSSLGDAVITMILSFSVVQSSADMKIKYSPPIERQVVSEVI